MQKLFVILSFLMGVVVLTSNYLVQFPIRHYELEEILTYGAFTYPIAFLITDLANKFYGKIIARKIVYVGFIIGVVFTLLFSTNFADLPNNRYTTVDKLAPPTNKDEFSKSRAPRRQS